ncbi:MAG: GFA family protein [Gammaproteobacteria bacterium]
MSDAPERRHARCHCGAVRFTVEFARGITVLRRCNCSLCRRRNLVVTAAPLAALTVTAGAGVLRLYQWNTRVARHYFCGRCGVYTHHRRRSDPREFAVNLACLDGPRPLGLPITPMNGAANSLVDPR